jgi:Ca2+-binding RTX toxin-like protein
MVRRFEGGEDFMPVFSGTAAADRIVGSAAADQIYGLGLNDKLYGGGGNDWLVGGLGGDFLVGGLGDDAYDVDSVRDQVVERAFEGTDRVRAWISYELTANVEILTLAGAADLNGTGNAKDNTITGNAGNNVLDGGAGDDVLIGGGGDDVYDVDAAGDRVREAAGAGHDRVRASVSHALGANVEDLVLTGRANTSGTGNALGNAITGSGGDNLINGGGGDDVLAGGLGFDTYYVGSVGDRVVEQAGQGTDRVLAWVSYRLTANVENLILQGATGLTGIGNAASNIIKGNAGNNLLDGGAGNDMLIGGRGDDIYRVDSAGDRVEEMANEGTDRVWASVSFTLGAHLEDLTLTGVANIRGTGNAKDNAIIGNAGNNVLDGGVGNDAMAGGAGNDIYDVDSTGDVVSEGANAGYDRVRASVTYIFSANVEELTLTGTGGIDGTGNALANTIVGNAGANELTGGGGDDVLIGGAGADQMVGGVGNDTYDIDAVGDQVVEAAGQGTDLICSSISYRIGTDVENLTLTGSANINGNGNGGNNLIVGNAGNNKLSGGAGDDRLSGGLGNDELWDGVGKDYLAGGSGNDNFFTEKIDLKVGETYDGGDGYDILNCYAFNEQVVDFSNINLLNLEEIRVESGTARLSISQISSINKISVGSLQVSDGGDIGVIGSSFDSYAMQLSNFGNSVRFIIDYSDHIIREIFGGSGDDSVICSNSYYIVSGGGGNDIISGGNKGDELLGGSGNDSINGGRGGDIIVGGEGDDRLLGGDGSDLFGFRNKIDGSDNIVDFNSSQGDKLLFDIDSDGLFFDLVSYLGSSAFTGWEGEARFFGGKLLIDMDGDARADITIKLDGITNASQLDQSDFDIW